MEAVYFRGSRGLCRAWSRGRHRDATDCGSSRERNVPPCSATNCWWDEVQMEARMPRQPPLHLGVFMRGVVVADQMEFPIRRRLVDELEELEPFLMAMPRWHVPKLALGHSGRRTRSWCRCVCSHASSCRNGPASSASPAACDPTLESGSSRQRTAPERARADRGTDRRCLPASRRTVDRC